MTRRLRVGILDILTTPSRSWGETAYDLVMTKQYASIMPQAIAVWCRELGHAAHYATYQGVGDPRRRLPPDLDLVFVAAYTQASALACALAKLYRRAGVFTVIGGPHATAFPRDCLRFFDLVVGECDRELVARILLGDFAPGTFVSSPRPLRELPGVAERMPELRTATFAFGRRPFAATTIPLLASTGCPYGCDFCIDGTRPYRQLPLERVSADLRHVAEQLPGVMVGFHDPNFGVRFDEILDAIEAVPATARPPYMMEASLAVLREDRTRRLRETNCVLAAPGIESWAESSPKTGSGRHTGREKLERVIERFEDLRHHVPYLQANFLFGLDEDAGDEPVELTRAFMERTPFVWPVVNIPHPFGGTPFFDRLRRSGRILETMPFGFYYSPWLVTTLANYTPAEYYRHLVTLFAHFTSGTMLRRRLATSASPFVHMIHVVRTAVKRRRLQAFRRILGLLETDGGLRDFHEGRTHVLPEVYHHEYERSLGPFAPLMTRADRLPLLDPLQPSAL